MYELKGVIYKIMEIIEISETKSKQEFIVKKGEQEIKFQLFGDKINLGGKVQQAFNNKSEVIIKFEITGRSWAKEDKTYYFTNLNVIDVVGGDVEAQTTQHPEITKQDDLPF